MARRLIVALLRAYQLVFRSVLPPSCRFHPSCSDYALQAFERVGPWKGLGITLKRIARCHPWNPGGFDPLSPPLPAPAEDLPEPRSFA